MATTLHSYDDDDAPLAPAGATAEAARAMRADATLNGIRVTGLGAATLGLISSLLLPYVLFMGVYEQWSNSMPRTVWLTTLFAVVTAGLSVVELIGGVGCLGLRRWGRRTLLGYALAMVPLGILASALFVPWLRHRDWSAGNRPAPATYDVLALIPLAAWGAGTLFALFLLYYLTRPHVRDAFATMTNKG